MPGSSSEELDAGGRPTRISVLWQHACIELCKNLMQSMMFAKLNKWNHSCIFTFVVVPCTPSERTRSTTLRVNAPNVKIQFRRLWSGSDGRKERAL